MRLQVRVGEHFPELLEHLEGFKPEYRGRRLLALAAMQLATSGNTVKTSVINHGSPAVDPTEQVMVEQEPQTPVKKKTPQWIKQNASA